MKMVRVVLPLVALLLTAACGSDESGDAPSPGSETQQLTLKYAQCMRDNGVSMPDPVEGEAGSMYDGVDQNSAAFRSADAACAPILQGVVNEREGQNGQDGTAQHEEMLALAKCLRDHGVDVPDPAPGMEKPFGDSLDRTNPAVAAAIDACAQALKPSE